MNLPEKLVLLRKQKGLTQQELAETLQVSRQAISRWEVGSAAPSTDNLKELSNLYDVSVDYLLGDDSGDISVPSDTQEKPKQNVQFGSNKKMHLVIIALSLVLAIVIVICSTIVHLQKEEENRIVPMSEMNRLDTDDGYPTIIFSFD